MIAAQEKHKTPQAKHEKSPFFLSVKVMVLRSRSARRINVFANKGILAPLCNSGKFLLIKSQGRSIAGDLFPRVCSRLVLCVTWCRKSLFTRQSPSLLRPMLTGTLRMENYGLMLYFITLLDQNFQLAYRVKKVFI